MFEKDPPPSALVTASSSSAVRSTQEYERSIDEREIAPGRDCIGEPLICDMATVDDLPQ